jgi:hypothetical protein
LLKAQAKDADAFGVPSSQTTPTTETSAACPRCRFRTLVAIDVTVAGEQLVMRCCSACNVRFWEGPAGRVSLSEVLARAAGA